MKATYSSTDIVQNNPQKIASSMSKTSSTLMLNTFTGSLPLVSQQLRKRSLIMQTKSIKSQTQESFEKQLSQIAQFDRYIEKEYKKMLNQKAENPTLIIPSGFHTFVHSKLFHNFLQKLYDYMDLLIEYQKKFEHIKQLTSKYEHTERYQPGLKKLRYQTNHLQEKCKQVSYVYMGILLSHGQSKRIFKDQYFFETMIYFISQILKSVFEEDDHAVIQEELNRIFRTNAFNLIKRRHDEDVVYEKYPSLKQAKYDSSTHGVSRMIKRLSIQKRFNYSVQIKLENTERLKKPLEIHLSPLGSVKSRSPLISSFYPSSKEKLFEFGKSARDKEELIKQAKGSSTFFYRRRK